MGSDFKDFVLIGIRQVDNEDKVLESAPHI